MAGDISLGAATGCVLAAFALALVAADGASAATGSQAGPLKCYEDTNGPDTCAGSLPGLDVPTDVTVSPDGKSVYAVSNADDSVIVWSRNAITGDLGYVECVHDNDTGTGGCTKSSNGLHAPHSVVVSPDNQSVYVVSGDDNAIVVFTRNTTTGALSFSECIEDDDVGADGCATAGDGLQEADDVAVSPNGLSVYAVATIDDTLVRFDRTSASNLNWNGCVKDNESAEDGCSATTLPAMENPLGVAVAETAGTGGAGHVYVSSHEDDAISWMSRSSGGALSGGACVEDSGPSTNCATEGLGLNGALGVAVSPNGASVYVAGQLDDAVLHLTRTASTGVLAPGVCVRDEDTGSDTCSFTAAGLDGASAITVDPDAQSVYVASQGDDAVVTVDRNTGTGSISPLGCVDDNDAGQGEDDCGAFTTDGLQNARSVAMAPSGARLVYATAGGDDALTLLKTDHDSPQTTVDSGPNGPTTDPTPTFTFSSDEAGSTFKCRFDANAFAPCSGPGNSHTPGATLGLGPHTFEVQATDPFGNVDGTAASRAFTVVSDLDPPETTIDSGPDGPTPDPTPTFGFSSDEPGSSFECRFDLDAFEACSGPGNTHTGAGLEEGPHTFEVRATDPAGNLDGSAASRAFSVSVPTNRAAGPDADGDGIPTSWEQNGVHVWNNDFTVYYGFLDLPAMGASAQHKDLFVEIDAMTNHRLDKRAVDRVITMFGKAPVSNPDGQPGIRLHPDNGPGSTNPKPGGPSTWGALSQSNNVAHDAVLGSFNANGAYNWGELDAIKGANFSIVRSLVFRYGLAAHGYGSASNSSSGIARGLPGRDFLVTLGSWYSFETAGTLDQQTGTLAHEFGHTIGLRHGGGDHTQHKPNYLSIMNYHFQTTGIPRTNGGSTFDYSRWGGSFATGGIGAVDERALSESRGIRAPAAARRFKTVRRCPGGNAYWATIHAPLDWNCNGRISGTTAVDQNWDGSRQDLRSANDWARVTFTFDSDENSFGGSDPNEPQPIATPEIDDDKKIVTRLVPVITGDRRRPRLRVRRGARLRIRARDDKGLDRVIVTGLGQQRVFLVKGERRRFRTRVSVPSGKHKVAVVALDAAGPSRTVRLTVSG